jgi:hypothetical protein
LEYFLSDNIVWLAAYPKTGSTWVRTIVHQLLAPAVRAKEAIPSFGRDYPNDALDHEVIGTKAKVLRTHCHPDHKVFRALLEDRSDQVIGVITIQRHPLDVLLSQLNYSFILGREKSFKGRILKPVDEIIVDGDIDYYIDAFLEADGCPDHVKRCHSYRDFYAQWRKLAPGAGHLHLRYEEMVEDPIAGINALSSFFRLPAVDPTEIMNRVEKLTEVNGKFFWRKKAYNHREMLSEASIRRFEDGFSDGLQALGYFA